MQHRQGGELHRNNSVWGQVGARPIGGGGVTSYAFTKTNAGSRNFILSFFILMFLKIYMIHGFFME